MVSNCLVGIEPSFTSHIIVLATAEYIPWKADRGNIRLEIPKHGVYDRL